MRHECVWIGGCDEQIESDKICHMLGWAVGRSALSRGMTNVIAALLDLYILERHATCAFTFVKLPVLIILS